MKLHRQTSHENDEMRTHKWPQFVQDDVEHDDIYVMDEFICIWHRNSFQQKKNKTKMPDQACANPTGFTKHIAIGDKSDLSMNSIHNNTCHEMIWWSLQSK